MPALRGLQYVIALAVFWPAAGLACSQSYFDDKLDRPLLEEVAAYYDASVVFLARVGKIDELAPDPALPYWLSVAPFEVLETYYGRVEPGALIAGVMQGRPGLDGLPPPNNCMSAVLSPAMEGRPMLVFGNRVDRSDGLVVYRLALRSSHVDRCLGCDETLDRMRAYARFHGLGAATPATSDPKRSDSSSTTP